MAYGIWYGKRQSKTAETAGTGTRRPFECAFRPCKPLLTGIHSIDINRVAHLTRRATGNCCSGAVTIARTPFFCLLACWCMCTAADAGILVSRTEHGLQFTDAVALTSNAKVKALSLGDQTKLLVRISNLPATTF